MKIYTKKGDLGTTSLYGGSRRPKSDIRVETYGTLDELQAVLGVAMAELAADRKAQWVEKLEEIQHDIFLLCAILAKPLSTGNLPEGISTERIKRLEQSIDAMEEDLEPLTMFIMQGGSKAGASIHHARTVCRRGERAMVRLSEVEKETIDPSVLQYLNRLSDYLFVVARTINKEYGQKEIRLGRDIN